MKVYVAGPIFTPDHRARAQHVGEIVRAAGHTPVIPFPEDAEWPGPEDAAARHAVFLSCMEGVTGADAVIAVLDGADADSGTAFEVGVAHAEGIPVLGIRTDYRTLGAEGLVNVMLAEGVSAISRHPDDWDAVAKDVEAFLADPPARRGTRLVRDKEPAHARAAGRPVSVRKTDGAEYAQYLKRALAAAATRLASAEPQDEKDPLVDVLEAMETLIAYRAYGMDGLRRAKEKRAEEFGGYRFGYVTDPGTRHPDPEGTGESTDADPW